MTVDEAAVYIRNNVDIVEVVSRYVSLKKVGRKTTLVCALSTARKHLHLVFNPGKGILSALAVVKVVTLLSFFQRLRM